MKHITPVFVTIFALLMVGNAYATVAQNAVTSKLYVDTEVAKKQNNIPAGTTVGSVVTYTGSSGSVGEHAVYDSSASYNGNGLVQANHVNKAIQNGLNDHLSCVDSDTDNGRCWLYEINTQSANAVYTEHAN